MVANLVDIKPDPYYGFQVFYNGVESVKAKFVAVLIASPNNSQPPENVSSGYKVTTSRIIDVANPDADQQGAYTVTGYCSINDMPNFKLDPPRGKSQRTAVVLISKMDPEGYQVHKQEHIEPADAANACHCFRKLRALCTKIHPKGGEKRSHAMGDLFTASPRDTKKCRTLQAQPTDASLNEEEAA